MVKVSFRCNYDFQDIRELSMPIETNIEAAIAKAKQIMSERTFHADIVAINTVQ